jgi:hypothetical protein
MQVRPCFALLDKVEAWHRKIAKASQAAGRTAPRYG